METNCETGFLIPGVRFYFVFPLVGEGVAAGRRMRGCNIDSHSRRNVLSVIDYSHFIQGGKHATSLRELPHYAIGSQIDEKVGSDILSAVHPLNLISRTVFDRPRNSPSPTRGKAGQKVNASYKKVDTTCVSFAIVRAEPFRCAKRIGPYGWFPIFRLALN